MKKAEQRANVEKSKLKEELIQRDVDFDNREKEMLLRCEILQEENCRLEKVIFDQNELLEQLKADLSKKTVGLLETLDNVRNLEDELVRARQEISSLVESRGQLMSNHTTEIDLIKKEAENKIKLLQSIVNTLKETKDDNGNKDVRLEVVTSSPKPGPRGLFPEKKHSKTPTARYEATTSIFKDTVNNYSSIHSRPENVPDMDDLISLEENNYKSATSTKENRGASGLRRVTEVRKAEAPRSRGASANTALGRQPIPKKKITGGQTTMELGQWCENTNPSLILTTCAGGKKKNGGGPAGAKFKIEDQSLLNLEEEARTLPIDCYRLLIEEMLLNEQKLLSRLENLTVNETKSLNDLVAKTETSLTAEFDLLSIRNEDTKRFLDQKLGQLTQFQYLFVDAQRALSICRRQREEERQLYDARVNELEIKVKDLTLELVQLFESQQEKYPEQTNFIEEQVGHLQEELARRAQDLQGQDEQYQALLEERRELMAHFEDLKLKHEEMFTSLAILRKKFLEIEQICSTSHNITTNNLNASGHLLAKTIPQPTFGDDDTNFPSMKPSLSVGLTPHNASCSTSNGNIYINPSSLDAVVLRVSQLVETELESQVYRDVSEQEKELYLNQLNEQTIAKQRLEEILETLEKQVSDMGKTAEEANTALLTKEQQLNELQRDYAALSEDLTEIQARVEENHEVCRQLKDEVLAKDEQIKVLEAKWIKRREKSKALKETLEVTRNELEIVKKEHILLNDRYQVVKEDFDEMCSLFERTVKENEEKEKELSIERQQRAVVEQEKIILEERLMILDIRERGLRKELEVITNVPPPTSTNRSRSSRHHITSSYVGSGLCSNLTDNEDAISASNRSNLTRPIKDNKSDIQARNYEQAYRQNKESFKRRIRHFEFILQLIEAKLEENFTGDGKTPKIQELVPEYESTMAKILEKNRPLHDWIQDIIAKLELISQQKITGKQEEAELLLFIMSTLINGKEGSAQERESLEEAARILAAGKFSEHDLVLTVQDLRNAIVGLLSSTGVGAKGTKDCGLSAPPVHSKENFSSFGNAPASLEQQMKSPLRINQPNGTLGSTYYLTATLDRTHRVTLGNEIASLAGSHQGNNNSTLNLPILNAAKAMNETAVAILDFTKDLESVVSSLDVPTSSGLDINLKDLLSTNKTLIKGVKSQVCLLASLFHEFSLTIKDSIMKSNATGLHGERNNGSGAPYNDIISQIDLKKPFIEFAKQTEEILRNVTSLNTFGGPKTQSETQPDLQILFEEVVIEMNEILALYTKHAGKLDERILQGHKFLPVFEDPTIITKVLEENLEGALKGFTDTLGALYEEFAQTVQTVETIGSFGQKVQPRDVSNLKELASSLLRRVFILNTITSSGEKLQEEMINVRNAFKLFDLSQLFGHLQLPDVENTMKSPEDSQMIEKLVQESNVEIGKILTKANRTLEFGDLLDFDSKAVNDLLDSSTPDVLVHKIRCSLATPEGPVSQRYSEAPKKVNLHYQIYELLKENGGSKLAFNRLFALAKKTAGILGMTPQPPSKLALQ